MESVRRFIELCGQELGWNKNINEESIIWEGEGVEEIGRRADNNQIVIKIDSRYFRPAEVDTLIGDASKAKEKLGWVSKTSLEELISDMIQKDKQEAKKDLYLENINYD